MFSFSERANDPIESLRQKIRKNSIKIIVTNPANV